jgi:NAD(P)-dependent dehydrogenase (short-subunit alcohol dehydrogenase family)
VTSKITNRTVLVTGGASGIGLGICERFALANWNVVIADRDFPAAERARVDLQTRFPDVEVHAVHLDVTDVHQIGSVLRELDARAPLDCVVCNAGVAFQAATVDVTPEMYDRLMAVNVRGVFFTMQAALRVMVPRRTGSIIAISSTSAFTASTGPMAAYDASKAAVRMFTASMAREVAPEGVRVNSVAPGTVETALTQALASAEQLDALAQSRVPMRRLGAPGEIGAACVYLASDDASYVTGHTLVVDGGWLA